VIDAGDPREFARRIPKAEIHLHLEGSVELPTLLRIAGGTGGRADDATRRRLAGLYTHRDFPDFLQNFRRLCAELRRPEDFAVIVEDLSRRLQDDNVRYAEVFCSPIIFRRACGLAADEILDAVSGSARRREREGGPRLRFLLDGVRQFGVEGMEEVVQSASACRRYDVIGVGMGGDEKAARTAAFAGPYREARRLGLRTTVHAGEFDGPRSVWEAIEVLETERIGHGVRAMEDRVLVGVLRDRGVPLECCPTSNIRTGTVRGWEGHPIRDLHRAGVRVSVNSDDPALFSTTLVDEWSVLITHLGLTREETLAIGMRTARSTFLPEAERETLAGEMARAGREAGVEA
jgi:aminodeoxyfutalosine deaminase